MQEIPKIPELLFLDNIIKKWFLTLIVAGFLKSVLHYTKTGFISNYTKQIGFMAKYYKP